MVIIHKKHKESPEEKEARLHQEQEKAMGIQDQYQARGFELVSWVQHHKGLVVIGIVGILLLGAAYSGYIYYQNQTSQAASGAYLSAVKEIETLENSPENKEKLKSAQANLTELAKSYASSGVSALANLYAGHLALSDGDAAQAVALYQSAVAKMGKADELYPLALIGLGYAQDKNGDANAALASFEAVVENKSGIGVDLALWEAARLAKQVGQEEKVKKYTARLLEEYPASAYEKNAKKLKSEVQK